MIEQEAQSTTQKAQVLREKPNYCNQLAILLLQMRNTDHDKGVEWEHEVAIYQASHVG